MLRFSIGLGFLLLTFLICERDGIFVAAGPRLEDESEPNEWDRELPISISFLLVSLLSGTGLMSLKFDVALPRKLFYSRKLYA